MNNTSDNKVQAELQKLLAETANINKKTKWYEAVLLVGAVTALLAAGKYLFKLRRIKLARSNNQWDIDGRKTHLSLQEQKY